ncbi:hypothetical protein D3C71_1876900 [compost metagenome]
MVRTAAGDGGVGDMVVALDCIELTEQCHQAHEVGVHRAKGLDHGGAQPRQAVVGPQGPEQHDGNKNPEKGR